MNHVLLDFCNTETKPSCVAFGYFDGVHTGHRAVIKKVCGHKELAPVIVSVDETVKPVIYTEIEKEEILGKLGVETMVSVNAENYRAMTAEDICSAIAHKLNAKTVAAGENIRFGSDGKGIEELKALGKKYGFEVETVAAVYCDGEEVSTEAIKQAIKDNDFEKMSRLLGDTYIMMGKVVYGTLSIIEGRYYRGMTNVGLRPSDDDIPIATVETFILNFDQDIYDKDVLLQVYTYIRGVKKFSGGLDEVRKQIDKDIEQVKTYMDEVVRKLGV